MSIVKTLLHELFLNPNPIPARIEIYQQLQDRIFPNKDLFIKYLTTEDSNEQTEIAKQLIQRLCFESHFSPPYSILLNLLEFEKSDANKSNNYDYIPQDHFQHTLNTYLLGIYIFFYQPQINKRLTQEFMTRINEGNPILNATKDFISFWKYFCLFHDISYPIEASYPWNKEFITLKSDNQNYIDCYNNIPTLLMYEWIATIISHLVVINEMLNDSDNLSLPTYFTNNQVFSTGIVGDEDLTRERIRSELADYISIDKAFDYDHFKMFSGFVNEKDCIIVVFNLMSGEPVCIRCNDVNGNTKDYLWNSVMQYRDEIINLLESEEPLRNKRFGIKYFIKNGTYSFQNSLKSVTGPISTDYINQIKAFLDSYQISQTPFTESQCNELSLVITAEDINELVFYYFKRAYAFIMDVFESRPYSGGMLNYIQKKNRDLYLTYMKTNFAKKILEEAETMIEMNAEKTSSKFAEWQESGFPVSDEKLSMYSATSAKKEKLCDYVEEFMRAGFRINDPEIKVITKTVIERMQSEILSGMSETEGLCSLFDFLFTVLKSFPLDNTKDDCFNPIQDLILAPNENPSVLELFQSINAFIQGTKYTNCGNEIESISYANTKIDAKLPGSTIETLFMKYRNKKAQTQIDHGLMGSIIVLYSQLLAHCYVPVIEKEGGAPTDTAASFLAPLFWSINTKNYLKKLISNYTIVFSRVFSAILCHNIYPDQINWGKNNWVFSLRDDPCEYYAMFIDALQLWRRDKYHHQNLNLSPLYSMDSYDIKAGSRIISISVNSYTKKIPDLSNKLMNYDNYLSQFSSLVKISISS